MSTHSDAAAPSPAIRRRLAAMERRGVNFDPSDTALFTPANGWEVVDLVQELPPEPPGEPVAGGSWVIAQRLMHGYEFADPSIVRAYYDHYAPLENRTMVLRLTALHLLHVYVGVRVARVYREQRPEGGSQTHVWGWSYRTLEGHVEMGEMAWEVWKREDTGQVEFHVHSHSRRAPITNPFVNLGFRLTSPHERRTFLDNTKRRMLALTSAALHAG